jgi:tRNA wybutosine-synthesizing protein 2
MFANGNVGEKRRLAEVAGASKGNELEAAVDLFAGIGYFAFSLAKARYAPVLCWELNAWSLEGLRRGAGGNGWGCYDVVGGRNDGLTDERDAMDEDEDECSGGIHSLPDAALSHRFLLFHESNARALHRIHSLRHRLPPIRHVSCGYLPSSASSWADAVRILDPQRGGWVHAHENCAVGDVEQRARDVQALFQSAADQLDGRRRVVCEHVERVKTYAPGVLHCVFDMRIELVREAADVDVAAS